MEKQHKIKNKKITPEEYNKILNSISIKMIRMIESSAYCDKEHNDKEKLIISIDNDKINYNLKKVNILELEQEFYLKAKYERCEKDFVNISVKYQIIIDSKETITKEFVDIYKKIGINMITWPYFREFVNEMTSRMYIPPMIMPFYKR